MIEPFEIGEVIDEVPTSFDRRLLSDQSQHST